MSEGQLLLLLVGLSWVGLGWPGLGDSALAGGSEGTHHNVQIEPYPWFTETMGVVWCAMELDRRKRESLVEARPPKLRQLHELTPAEGALCSMVHHVFWHFSKPKKGIPSPTFMKVKLKSISDRYKYIGEVPCFFVIPITYDKVNRCLARYSPRATTTNRPTTGH